VWRPQEVAPCAARGSEAPSCLCRFAGAWGPNLVSLLVFAYLWTGCSPSAGTQSLILEELWARALPRAFGVPTGASILGDTVIVWSSVARAVLVTTPESVQQINLPGTEPIYAHLSGTTITVIEADPPALVEISLLDGTEARRELRIPGMARSGGWGGRHAFVAVDVDSALLVFRIDPKDASSVLVRHLGRPGHITASRSGLVVSTLSTPFVIKHFDLAGELKYTASVEPTRIDSLARGDLDALWVPLPAFELFNGQLFQTLSDLRSDRRVLLTFSPDSPAPVGMKVISIPMAFLAADEHRSTIAGVRVLNQAEVVVYRVVDDR
jgi:hypothetical protein